MCDIPFTTPDGTTAITDRGERELAAASQRKTAKCEIVDFKIDPWRGPLLTDLRYDPGFAKISSNSGNFPVFFRLPTQNSAKNYSSKFPPKSRQNFPKSVKSDKI